MNCALSKEIKARPRRESSGEAVELPHDQEIPTAEE